MRFTRKILEINIASFVREQQLGLIVSKSKIVSPFKL